MPWTSRPFNYYGTSPTQILDDLTKANDNFEILGQAFVDNNPTTQKAKDADKVDGYHASQTPSANTIPVAKSDGKLDAGWLPVSGGFTNFVEFTSSTTWVVPSDVNKILIYASGGGGGGGAGQSHAGSSGGGGGVNWRVRMVTVVPGETLTITIGAGGAGATTAGGNGGNGGTTTVSGSSSGVLISVSGGRGGRGGFFDAISDSSGVVIDRVGIPGAGGANGGETGHSSSGGRGGATIHPDSTGGQGATSSSSATSGSLGGGGGGGFSSSNATYRNGANGGSGWVWIFY